jgi:hypothetical protein
MMMPALTLRHLCFSGPDKEPASVSFDSGLNVIYGASETGKSFILEALDFMLGAGADLRDIPERVGYDRVFLGIDSGGETFTLERSTSGGQFRCYSGLHSGVPNDIEPIILAAKHNPTRRDNLSTFLLEKIELAGKRIRRNAGGDKNSLSFRNLAHLCLISEGDIQKRGSPIETGQFTSKTLELSVFKLLLTGVDDSAIQPAERERVEFVSRAAKVEVIDELVAEHKARLVELVGEEDDSNELTSQLERLDANLDRERSILRQTEQTHRDVLQRRTELRRNSELAKSRRLEIDELVARFNLLDRHYQSDLARLEGVRESGTLLAALSPGVCPLCGAFPGSQRHDVDCDGNIDVVIAAADAEKGKITLLRNELRDALNQLNTEATHYDRWMPQLFSELETTEARLNEINPSVSEQRATYSEIVERRSTVQNALSLVVSIADLENRKAAVEAARAQRDDKEASTTDLSDSTLDSFSSLLEKVLKAWNFPDASRVHFDKTTRDFVISGKPRGSRGKGMRAITHAAFTVALLQYALSNALAHPGFAVLDTPLLAYREPEGEEDDLSGTDVQDRFYEYLLAFNDGQVIVLENVDPPDSVKARPQSIFFSKNPQLGRYGFFPSA